MGQNTTYPTPSGLHPETEDILLKLGLDPIKVRAFTEGANDTINHPTPPTPGNLLTTGIDTVQPEMGPLATLGWKTLSQEAGHYLDKLLHPDPQPTPGNDFGDPNAPKPTGGATGPSADSSGASPSSASGSSVASTSNAADPTALAALGGSGSAGTDSTTSPNGGAQNASTSASPADQTAFDATGAPVLAANDPAYDDGTLSDQDVAELTPNFAPDQMVMNDLDLDQDAA